MTDGHSLDPEDLQSLRILEAVLFASSEPVGEAALGELLPVGSDVRALMVRLQERYEGRGVEVRRAGATWAFRTAPDLAHVLTVNRQDLRKLSRAAMETLAIVAYHQPVTRAEIEDIRGVALSRGTLDILVEAGWVHPKGRRNSPGRPLTWGTTDAFLDHFGLESLKDLPGVEELKAAGLLDNRPTVTYGTRARDDGSPIDTEEEENEAVEQYDLLSGSVSSD